MRVLVVCFADSTHSQAWIELFNNTELDLRVYAASVSDGGMHQPIPWHRPTYVLNPLKHSRGEAKVVTGFSDSRLARSIYFRFDSRFSFNQRFFRQTVARWKPDIVHCLSFELGGFFAWQELKKMTGERPRLVISSWGSDINVGKENPATRVKLEEVIHNCDGFIADCKRDIKNAFDLGLKPEKLGFDFAVPVTGGIDLKRVVSQTPLAERKIILIPKAYEGEANKTLPILEALRLLEDQLQDYEIHLLMCSEEVRRYLSKMPESIRRRCHTNLHVPPAKVLELMARARVMAAPSISDGTPLSMLEAMAMGVLPLMSPLESIREWITDGENGLFAHALYPDKIAHALHRALTDDDLCRRAAATNRNLIETQCNRDTIREQMLRYYQSLIR